MASSSKAFDRKICVSCNNCENVECDGEVDEYLVAKSQMRGDDVLVLVVGQSICSTCQGLYIKESWENLEMKQSANIPNKSDRKRKLPNTPKGRSGDNQEEGCMSGKDSGRMKVSDNPMTKAMIAELRKRLWGTAKEFVEEMQFGENVAVALKDEIDELFSDWKKELEKQVASSSNKLPSKKAKRVGSVAVAVADTGTFELNKLGLASSVTMITPPEEGSNTGNPDNPGEVYEFVSVVDRQMGPNGYFLYRVDWGEGFQQTWEPVDSLLEIDARELAEIQITADYRDSVVASNATLFPGKENLLGRIPLWKMAELPHKFAENYSRKLHHWVEKEKKKRQFLQRR